MKHFAVILRGKQMTCLYPILLQKTLREVVHVKTRIALLFVFSFT